MSLNDLLNKRGEKLAAHALKRREQHELRKGTKQERVSSYFLARANGKASGFNQAHLFLRNAMCDGAGAVALAVVRLRDRVKRLEAAADKCDCAPRRRVLGMAHGTRLAIEIAEEYLCELRELGELA